MKTLNLLIAFTLSITIATAAEPKAEPKAKPEAKPAAATAPKELPFHAVVDSMDATSFTHKNKDGVAVKMNITDKTVIHQGKADAKFTDIKVGDEVDGMRTKTKPDGTEYEVNKITKFGKK